MTKITTEDIMFLEKVTEYLKETSEDSLMFDKELGANRLETIKKTNNFILERLK